MSYSSDYRPRGCGATDTPNAAASVPSQGSHIPATPNSAPAAAVQQIISSADPVSGLLTGVICQFLTGVGKQAQDHLGERLWAVIEKKLDPAEVEQATADIGQDGWTRSLHARIETLLAQDPALAHAVQRMMFGNGGFDEALWQLPAADPNFSNREQEMRKIRQAFRPPTLLGNALAGPREWLRASTPAAGVVVGITGPRMSGKTELAVHAAQQVAAHYPDGCFVVDLGRSQGSADGVTDGLVDLLRGQGVALRDIPETRELALRLYRSWFHRKRVLVVIENACSLEEARPFLPPERQCGAIVTGPDGAIALPEQYLCALPGFTRKAARKMLCDLDPRPGRWSMELRGEAGMATRRVLDWCGREPAVIAHVASASRGSLSARTSTEIADALWASGDATSTALLTAPSRFVLSLHHQYEHIAENMPETARLFRLLGLLSMPHIDESVAASMMKVGKHNIRRSLSELADAGLLRATEGAYHLPPYLQRFGENLAREHDTPKTQRAALTNAFRHLLERDERWSTAEAISAHNLITADARERANRIAVVCRAFAEGMFEWCARLAIRCAEFVESRGYLRAWATIADLGARAASRLPPGGTRSELLARSRLNLAAATDAQGGTGEAIGSRESALRSIRALARIGLLHLDEGDAVKAELPSAVCTELITADGRRQWRDHVGAATEQLRAEVLGVVEDLAGRLRS